MNILQVVRQYLPSTGGMETYVSSLCRQLAARGHSADVATLDYLFKSHEPLPHYELVEGTNVVRLPSAGTARFFVAPRLRKTKCDWRASSRQSLCKSTCPGFR